MPPPGYEPFLRAICADPEDDTVRLVYADWLDENGDPDRAEFIRLQIDLVGEPVNTKTRARRARSLLKVNGARWRGEVPSFSSIDWALFERGFLTRLSIRTGWSPSDFVTACAVAPVSQIQICHCRPWTLQNLIRFAEFSRIRILEAHSGYVDDATLSELATCANASRLEALKLPGELWGTTANGREKLPQVTDGGAVALTSATALTSLRRLHLPKCHISAEGWAILKARYPFASDRDWRWPLVSREQSSPPPPGGPLP